MARLTKRFESGNAGLSGNGTIYENALKIPDVLSKLCDYEDAEEQGRLLPSRPVVATTTYSDEDDGRHYLLQVTCEITKEQFDGYAENLRNEDR